MLAAENGVKPGDVIVESSRAQNAFPAYVRALSRSDALGSPDGAGGSGGHVIECMFDPYSSLLSGRGYDTLRAKQHLHRYGRSPLLKGAAAPFRQSLWQASRCDGSVVAVRAKRI